MVVASSKEGGGGGGGSLGSLVKKVTSVKVSNDDHIKLVTSDLPQLPPMATKPDQFIASVQFDLMVSSKTILIDLTLGYGVGAFLDISFE